MESGLYRVTSGQRTALAAAGALNPIELSDVRTTDQKVAADVATGGGTYWVGPGSTPDIRRVGADRTASGRGWPGLPERDYVVTGVSEMPLLPGLFALLLALGAFLLAWRREGDRSEKAFPLERIVWTVSPSRKRGPGETARRLL